MKTYQLVAVLLLVAAAGAGCIQDLKTLQLKKDGSGTLVEEIYMSPQLTGMMAQMTAGLAQTIEQGGAQVAGIDKAKVQAALEPLALFKSDIAKRTAALGPDVQLVSAQAKTSDKGWKGYVLTYSFLDVTKLKLTLLDRNMAGGGLGGDQQQEAPLLLTFRKEPLPEITFRQQPSAPTVSRARPDDPAGAVAGAGSFTAAMLAPLLQGLRVSFSVEVEGKITRTSGHYQQGKHRVVLLDLQMDKVLAHPEGIRLLDGGKADPAVLQKLRDLQIPGLAVEDLQSGLSIEWK